MWGNKSKFLDTFFNPHSSCHFILSFISCHSSHHSWLGKILGLAHHRYKIIPVVSVGGSPGELSEELVT